MHNSLTPVFITFVDPDYSRSGVYLNQFIEEKETYKLVQLKNNGKSLFFQLLRYQKIIRDKKAILIVMSPCSLLVPLLKLISARPIVLDAGWPLTDSLLVRGNRLFDKIKYYKIWIIDFIAFHLANVAIFESNQQILHVSKLYKVKKSKLRRIFTGVNEKRFKNTSSFSNNLNFDELLHKIGKDFIFFRGKNNAEAGITNLLEIAKLTKKPYKFVIQTNSIPKNLTLENNVILVTEFLSDDNLLQLYNKCFLSIGQISNSARLERTIPHKSFESALIGVPYLTLRRKGILEFLINDFEAIFFDKIDPKEMAKVIDKLFSDSEWQKELTLNIKKAYGLRSSQLLLKAELVQILEGLC